MTENNPNCVSISLFECKHSYNWWNIWNIRLKTGVCSMAMPRVVIVHWEFSNPLQNSEAQKIFNFQESWNSLIQDFLYIHSNILCWKISWWRRKQLFLNFLPMGSFFSHKFSNWDRYQILNTHIFETSGHIFISFHRLDRVGKTLPKIIILTQFTD